MRICLDPGHGGSDPGAVGPTGLQEADVTLQLCQLLCDKLLRAGHDTVLTRDINNKLPDDYTANWKSRAFRANSSGCDVYISMHCRVADPDDPGGTATKYTRSHAFSALLAQQIQDRLDATEGCMNLGVFGENGLAETRKVNAPAVVVEIATITNKDDELLLQDLNWANRMLDSIVTALTLWGVQMGNIVSPPDANQSKQSEADAQADEITASASAQTPATNVETKEPAQAPATEGVSKGANPAPTIRVTPRITAQIDGLATADSPLAPDVGSKRTHAPASSATTAATAGIPPARAASTIVPATRATNAGGAGKASMRGVRVTASTQVNGRRTPIASGIGSLPPKPGAPS